MKCVMCGQDSNQGHYCPRCDKPLCPTHGTKQEYQGVVVYRPGQGCLVPDKYLRRRS